MSNFGLFGFPKKTLSSDIINATTVTSNLVATPNVIQCLAGETINKGDVVGTLNSGSIPSISALTNNAVYPWTSTSISEVNYPGLNYISSTGGSPLYTIPFGSELGTSNSVAALVDGGFVVAGKNSAPGHPRFIKYDADGSVGVSNTTIEAVTTTMTQCAPLTGGGFVVVYINASNYPKFGRYNSSGVLQGSLTVVENYAATQISVAGLADGGFVVSYASASGIKFARYNSSGVLQGSITTVEAVNISQSYIAGLPNGDFVVTYAGSGTSSYPKFGRYDSTGTLQGSLTVVEAAASTYPKVCSLSGGGFVIVYNLTSTAFNKFGRYDSTGTLQGSLTVVEASLSTGSYLGIAPLANGGFVVSYDVSTNVIKFLRFNSSGTSVGSSITVDPGFNTAFSFVTELTNGFLLVCYNNTSAGATKFAKFNSDNLICVVGTEKLNATTIADESGAQFANVISNPSTGGFIVAFNGNGNSYYPKGLMFNASKLGEQSIGVSFTAETEAGQLLSLCMLNNGNIVYAYKNNNNVKFAIFNSSGVKQGSTVTVDTMTGMVAIEITALADGGFVIFYAGPTGKFARYNSAGTLQGSLITVTNSACSWISGTNTVDGGYAAVFSVSGGTSFIAKFNSNNKLVFIKTLADATGTTNTITSLADNSLIVASLVSSLVKFTKIDASGNTAIQYTTVDPIAGAYYSPHVSATPDKKSFVVSYRAQYGGITSHSIKNVRFNQAGTMIGVPVTLAETVNTGNVASAILKSGEIVTVFYNAINYVTFTKANFYPNRVIFGVSLDAVSAGSTFNVQVGSLDGSTSGVNCTTLVNFGPAKYTFDDTAFNGSKGYLINNVLHLNDLA